MKKNRYTRGDTMIEVLIAIAVFSSVAVASLNLMNQGSEISQRALEITLVRQEMDSQAETLRFLNSSYIATFKTGVAISPGTSAGQWVSIRNNTVSSVSSFGNSSTCVTPPANSFVLNTHNATLISSASTLVPAQTFSQVNYGVSGSVTSAEGIWIEAIKYSTSTIPNETTAGYIDFHIRACWISPGQSIPMTLGTIVRLYEPISDYTSPLIYNPLPTPAPPATPTVTVLTSGSTSTWSWSAPVCPVGVMPNYQYDYSVDDGYNSGWVSTSSNSVSFTIPSEGYQATLQVKAQCYEDITSGWSGVGSNSYLAPINPPSAIAFSITRPTGTYDQVILSATSSCTTGGTISLMSRADVALTWNYWWNGTPSSTGWYADSHSGVWIWDYMNYYTTTTPGIVMSVNIPSGKQFGMAVEMQCSNWATHRVSASTGRVETMALYAP